MDCASETSLPVYSVFYPVYTLCHIVIGFKSRFLFQKFTTLEIFKNLNGLFLRVPLKMQFEPRIQILAIQELER